VFEHLERPEIVTAELQRVLRPGGWLFVRTPNRIGYVALITSLIPNKLHSAILKYVQPDRKDVDVFPTYYRINNLSQFKKYFPKFTIGSTTDNWEPQYFFGNRVLYIMNRIFHKCMPKSLGMTSIFYAQKNT
jgi:2-polyprenyl-3-methyl-5-hydroxy-6-metoxy-1,4-benzoquinol methylase